MGPDYGRRSGSARRGKGRPGRTRRDATGPTVTPARPFRRGGEHRPSISQEGVVVCRTPVSCLPFYHPWVVSVRTLINPRER